MVTPEMPSELETVSIAAVDVGGTFTDLVAITSRGPVTLKVPSTPAAPEKGVLDAIAGAGAAGAPLVHGSTVATNAILERSGAKTAFVATAGFADIIEIGRQERPYLYRLDVRKPEPLVPRNLRFEARERVGPGGALLQKLTRSDAKQVASKVASSGARSAAVCLLFSFEHPHHEEMLREELEKLGVAVSLSSWVLPEYREYERASTTVINAFVSPVMEGYLDRLEDELDTSESGGMRLMHSAGGTISSELARHRAADLVLSGPAGGAVASSWLAGSLGLDDVISFDMGGTSTDVSLMSGEPTVTRETRINGLPVALPMIDIHTIGAGGGSIAHVDRAGVLKVGPESAGADPGPACYGKSMLPTVTDANLALGRLEPSWFLGGRMTLQVDKSITALGSLAGPANVAHAARSTLEVAYSHMEAAVKKVSLERGFDPREFALVAFGGAGPMHACELSARLEIPRVIVPVYPGLFSSIGMLLAQPGRDHSRSSIGPLDDLHIESLSRTFSELERQASDEMKREGFSDGLQFRRTLAMRYRGQSHEVSVPVRRLRRAEVERHFQQAYRAAFGYLREGQEIEVVNVHLACRAPRRDVPLATPVAGTGRAPRPLSRKKTYFERGGMTECRVFARSELSPEHPIKGPALVLQADTTTLVPPGWRSTVDIMGNLDLEAL